MTAQGTTEFPVYSSGYGALSASPVGFEAIAGGPVVSVPHRRDRFPSLARRFVLPRDMRSDMLILGLCGRRQQENLISQPWWEETTACRIVEAVVCRVKATFLSHARFLLVAVCSGHCPIDLEAPRRNPPLSKLQPSDGEPRVEISMLRPRGPGDGVAITAKRPPALYYHDDQGPILPDIKKKHPPRTPGFSYIRN